MENIEKKQPKWEELSISNDFLFGKVMQDAELCKELLQRILPDLKIEHIEYPELQKSIKPDVDARSVRLDVYVQDDKDIVYDIEMQVSDTGELPKRSRYYQSMIDLQLIDKGQYYKKLNRSYIIFICPFDAYGKGRHIYTFENICKEDNSISMGDEAVKIFLNASGTMDDVSDELKAFLDYVAGKRTEDSYVEKLEEAVRKAKKNREWRALDIQWMSDQCRPERSGDGVYDVIDERSGKCGKRQGTRHFGNDISFERLKYTR